MKIYDADRIRPAYVATPQMERRLVEIDRVLEIIDKWQEEVGTWSDDVDGLAWVALYHVRNRVLALKGAQEE